jgi:tetratricopeptide (TPR) repeat protein
MKAFLSHSSQDKELVRAVAKELGRRFCVFDEQVFSTGIEFKESIKQSLDETSVFVLFASQKALESVWVKFELDEAWFRKLQQSLSKSLVYLINSSVQVDDLPDWLQRALIRRENTAQIIARDIRSHLDALLRERQHTYFVGRVKEIEKLEQALTPVDGSLPPHAIFVTGLPGNGRRSLIRKTIPSILNLKKHVEIRIGEGLTINDICAIIADRVEPYSTNEGLKRIVSQIQSLSESQALERTLINLRKMVSVGELPIFFDEGGLLDSEGNISKPIQSILRSLTPYDEAYIFFVSTRKPLNNFSDTPPTIQLDHLREEESKRLLALLANQERLELKPSQISELAYNVAGYPPAAYFAIQQAKNYGIDIVIQNKEPIQFRAKVFLNHLAKINLTEQEQNILRLLAMYSPLPLNVIGEVLMVNLESISKMLMQLIDMALVVLNEDSLYQIADPVEIAASRAFGVPKEEENRILAKRLSVFLKTPGIEPRRLGLSRVLFRVASLAKDYQIKDMAIRLSNDLIKLTETLYHRQRHPEAIEMGFEAIKERPESETARSYLIRSLIQEERWVEAEEQIQQFRRYAPLRDTWFLTGFLERKRDQISAAINAYRDSERLGRRGVAISRELALCYLLEGKLDLADKYINQALKLDNDNSYVIDLWAQIATRRGDEDAARRAVDRLKDINEVFYYHRLSRIELAFGNKEEAEAAAQNAVALEASPPFAVLVQLAYCKILMAKIEDAASLLNEIDEKFSRIRRDIRTGLRCRLALSRGDYAEALGYSNEITNKNTGFYKRIRYDAIAGELETSALKDRVREDYEKELDLLSKGLTKIDEIELIPVELEIPLSLN